MIATIRITGILPQALVIAGLSYFVSEQVNVNFLALIAKCKEQNNTTSAIVYALTVVGGFAVWWFVLRNVMETDNKYKKVLQTLPAELILSNPQLKRYLLTLPGVSEGDLKDM